MKSWKYNFKSGAGDRDNDIEIIQLKEKALKSTDLFFGLFGFV